jgi:hypothetical protein
LLKLRYLFARRSGSFALQVGTVPFPRFSGFQQRPLTAELATLTGRADWGANAGAGAVAAVSVEVAFAFA